MIATGLFTANMLRAKELHYFSRNFFCFQLSLDTFNDVEQTLFVRFLDKRSQL